MSFTASAFPLFANRLLGRRKYRSYGIGGLNADVIHFAVFHHDGTSDEKRHLVEVDQDVTIFIQFHFCTCLSEVIYGIIHIGAVGKF